jgi:hypothetical protein
MRVSETMPMTDREVRDYFKSRSSDGKLRDRAMHADRLLREIADAESGKVSIEADGTAAQRVDDVTFDALHNLFTNRTCALHVRNFVSSATCTVLNKWIMSKSQYMWKNTDMYYGLGLPVNSLHGPTANHCLRYFKQAIPTMRKIRETSKSLAPLDKLRLELDEAWPAGARISTDNPYRRKMFVGLARVMRPEGLVGAATATEGLIHVDAPVFGDAAQGVFSANVYLKMPPKGGELVVWNIAVKQNAQSRRKAVLVALLANAFSDDHREKVQSALRKILPSPIIIKPAAGDLIILNSGRPHAVRRFSQGLRITMQTFIAYQEGQTLQLFS